MPTLLGRLADFPNLQGQVRLNRVEQGRFSYAALAGKYGLPVVKMLPQPVDPLSCNGAGQECWNAQLAVQANERLNESMIHQIGLVQTDDRCDPSLGGADQVAINQMRLDVRFDQRHDDDHLIDIGDDDVFPAARGASQQAMPRVDALDESFVVGRGSKPDAVAGG